MARPVLLPENLLRLPGATVTVTAADTDHPKERLFDDQASLAYEDTSNSGTRTLHADLGSAQTVSGWGLGSSQDVQHNLTGATLTLQSSTDNSSWTTRDAIVPASGGPLFHPSAAAVGVGSWAGWSAGATAGISARYWRLTIASAAAAPRIPEWVLGAAFALGMGPSTESFEARTLGNRVLTVSLGGYPWGFQRGVTRWAATWTVRNLDGTDKLAWEAAFADLEGGARPCLLRDEVETARWARLLTPDLVFRERGSAPPRYDLTTEWMEEL